MWNFLNPEVEKQLSEATISMLNMHMETEIEMAGEWAGRDHLMNIELPAIAHSPDTS